MSDQILPTQSTEHTPQPIDGAAGDPFPSLGVLRAAHNVLLDAHRAQGDADPFWQEATHFLHRGRATGALLDSEGDRQAAQTLLDYWVATGYSTGREMPDAVLEEFDPSLAPEIPDAHCPYVGLAAFHEGQHPYFFGRKQLVETLLDKVTGERLVAVIGSSGSGKSSIMLAGLLPKLQAGAIPRTDNAPASDQWRYSRRMVPGSNPLINLERAILPRSGEGKQPSEEKQPEVALSAKFAFAADGFRRETDYLVNLINETGDTPFVLVIDQFEEIFTLCTDEALRHAFIDNLLSLLQAEGNRHTILLTMRTDFESFVARLPAFQPYFEEAIVRVTPLNAGELRAVIEQPAALVGLKFEDGVVDALVQDVLGEPAALPLLQFTLLKLWETRERNRITWASYKELGGGRLALARSADRLYENLIPEEQVTARRILLRLVRPGEGLEITSNRVRRGVLYQTGEARDRVDRVLQRLLDASLLRLSPGEKPGDAQVEVAHEALVRNWPRLVGWLEDERGRIRERLRLTEAAEQWLKLDRDPGALLRGTLLDDAQRHPDLNELEQAFVAASLAARQAAAAEREAAHQRELEQARALAAEQERLVASERQWAEYQTLTAAKLRQRAWLLGLTTVAALLLTTLTIWLSSQATAERLEAETQAAIAITAQQEAVHQAATAAAASTASLEQAATAAAASTVSLEQAATANAAQQAAVIAQAAAEADAAAARTAEAIAVAEQTKVSLARGALANTVNELSSVLTAVAPAIGSADVTAIAPLTPITTVSPSLGTPTPPAPTEAAGVTGTLSAPRVSTPIPNAAVEAYANIVQAATPSRVTQPAMDSLTVAPAAATILTDTTSLRTLPTEPATANKLSGGDEDDDNDDDDDNNVDTENDETTEATATPISSDTTGAADGNPTTPATVIVTDVVPFLPNIYALVPEISVALYASATEGAEQIGTIRGPLRLPILEAGPFAVQVVVLDDPLPVGQNEQVDSAPLASNRLQTGWVQSWQLNYLGDRAMLPPELRHLVIQEQEVPYLQGKVVQVGEETGYPLLERLTDYTEVTTVPIGTTVTLISAANATPTNVTQTSGTEAAPNVWYYVSVVDSGEKNQIWRGYLPAAVVGPIEE